MAQRDITLTLFTSLWLGSHLYGQQLPTVTTPLPRYPGIRAQFNQSLLEARTTNQQLDVFRRAVSQGRHSGRPMLLRMFGNFEPSSFNLNPNTPGLSTMVRQLASDNRNVVAGHARTLRYAMTINNDPRFKVIGFNGLRRTALGKTDADIVLRHQSTGRQIRMEVKNVTPESQRSSLAKYKRQIDKMAWDARRTGEVQVWANRQNVVPELRQYAEHRGIRVEERLRTGNSEIRPGDRSYETFAKSLDNDLHRQARFTARRGSIKGGLGAFQVYQGSQDLWKDFNGVDGATDWLDVGEHASILTAGAGFTVAGGSELLRTTSPSLVKWGGRLGIGGLVVNESIIVGRYLSGDVTAREFYHGQASLGGGLVFGAVGGVGGFYIGGGIGAVVGSFIFPGVGTAVGFTFGSTIGSILGGVGGGYAGSHFAGLGIEGIFTLQDFEQQMKYHQFLLNHYRF